MTLDKLKYDEQQAKLCADDEHEFHGHRDLGPPTRYGLKHRTGYYLELSIGDSHVFSPDASRAKLFWSATEASLYALQHCVTGIEVVPV